jgi:hypothetical protein
LFLSPISPEEYIEQRLSDQIGWYDRKSSTNQRWFKRLRFAEIVAAATIPFLSGFAGSSFPIACLVSALTVGSAKNFFRKSSASSTRRASGPKLTKRSSVKRASAA